MSSGVPVRGATVSVDVLPLPIETSTVAVLCRVTGSRPTAAHAALTASIRDGKPATLFPVEVNQVFHMSPWRASSSSIGGEDEPMGTAGPPVRGPRGRNWQQ